MDKKNMKVPTILKVKDVQSDSRFDNIHPNLPQMPCLALLLGSVRSGKCLYEESLIQTDDGLKRICDVKIGEYVNSMNGYVKVLDVIKQGIKSTYQIQLTNGSKLILTDDHKLETSKGMKALRDCNDNYIITQFGKFKISSKRLYGEVMTYDLSVDHPDHTFFCNDISVSNSNLLCNFFLNDSFYKGLFDTVTFISTTLHQDNKGVLLSKYFDCHSIYDDSIIHGIMKEQAQYDREDRPSYALVVDDCLTQDFSKTNAVSFFSTVFRHHCDFYCVSTQSFRAVSGMIRNNANSIFICRQQNKLELDKIAEEYSGMVGGYDNFMKWYKIIHKEKYQIMYLDLQSNPARILHNFETVVWEGNDEEYDMDDE